MKLIIHIFHKGNDFFSGILTFFICGGEKNFWPDFKRIAEFYDCVKVWNITS